MSVFALRTPALRWLNLPTRLDNPTSSILRDLQPLLRQAISEQRMDDPVGDILIEIFTLAQLTVHTALEEFDQGQSYQALARHVGTMVLSIAASMNVSISEGALRTGPQLKLKASLLPPLHSIKQSLTKLVSMGRLTQTRQGGYPELDQVSRELKNSYGAFSLRMSLLTDNNFTSYAKEQDSDGLLLRSDEVEVQHRYKMQPTDSASGDIFWDNSYQATVRGSKAIVKLYDNAGSLAKFRQDVDILRTTRHNHLPALLGWSKRNAPTPFIAISMESFVPFFHFLPTFCETSPEFAVEEIWKMLIQMRSTVEYLANRKMAESARAIRETLKRAVVDNTGKIVLTPQHSSEVRGLLPLVLPLSPHDLAQVFSVIYEDDGREGSEGNFSESIDHLPRILRPIRYALIASPSAVLRSSFTSFGDTETQRQTLSRWRALPFRNREIKWPILYDDEVYHPVVGDIGRFSRLPNGELSFIRFGNIQHELGGFILSYSRKDDTERISMNVWRFPYSELFHRTWAASIPVEIALGFLLSNAERLGRQHATPAADLVLVTETYMQSLWRQWMLLEVDSGEDLESQADDQGAFMFAHFDHEGRPLACYRSNSMDPLDLEGPPYSQASDYPGCIVPYQAPSFIQIESYELRSDPTSPQQLSMGDIGYFETMPHGDRQFRVICNARKDLFDADIRPWEAQNSWEIVGEGVWRSSPMNFATDETLCFAWTVKASLNLPYDLERFYLFFLASDGGKKPFASNTDFQIVQECYYQIKATFSPQPGNQPLWLFVHFDKLGNPEFVYWCDSDEPRNPPVDRAHLPGCRIEICPAVARTPSDRQFEANRVQWAHQYIRNAGHYQSSADHRCPSGERPGDVGVWVRDTGGTSNSLWKHLGHVLPLGSRREIKCTTPTGSVPCQKISSNLWGSGVPLQFEYSETTTVHAHWIEDIPGELFSELSTVAGVIAQKHRVTLDNLEIVTQVTTTVEASASPAAMQMGARLSTESGIFHVESEDIAMAGDDMREPGMNDELDSVSDSSSDSGISGYLIHRVPDEMADGSDKDMVSEEDEDLHDLQFYMCFPPLGGCYGFWSSDIAGMRSHYRWVKPLNYQALSRLDLVGWRMTGCNLRLSQDIKRRPITELFGRSTERDISPVEHDTIFGD